MRHTLRNLLLIAVTVAAIAPSAATAAGPACGKDYSQNSVNGDYCAPTDSSGNPAAAMVCGRDYSRNSVDGNYCVSSVSSPIVAAPAPTSAPVASDDFSWGNAAVGAGVALLLIAAAGSLVAVVRRRRGSPPAGQQGSPATS